MSYQYPFKDSDEKLKLSVWLKGRRILGRNKNMWRRDKCGKLIKYSEHGNRDSEFGWEIDHKKPIAKDGDDSIDNLQPLHWKNNSRKGDTHPWFCKDVKFLIRNKKTK